MYNNISKGKDLFLICILIKKSLDLWKKFAKKNLWEICIIQ